MRSCEARLLVANVNRDVGDLYFVEVYKSIEDIRNELYGAFVLLHAINSPCGPPPAYRAPRT